MRTHHLLTALLLVGSTTHAGGTLRVPMHRAVLSGASGSFGIALHLQAQ